MSIAQVKTVLEDFKKLLGENTHLFNCELVDRKGLTHGIRLNVFALSHCKGTLDHRDTGSTEETWRQFTRKFESLCFKHFGGYVVFRIDKWDAMRKFQASIEIYIKYKEL